MGARAFLVDFAVLYYNWCIFLFISAFSEAYLLHGIAYFDNVRDVETYNAIYG